jgi:ubiquinone/menaquinone biosynthesis C-methylase UbiE
MDVGCGPGVMVEELLERGFEVWGIDVSEPMIEFGKIRASKLQLGRNCHLSVGDVENLAFPDGYFNAVICMGVFEYLPSHVPAIREIYRVLSPGGIAIISLPKKGSPFNTISAAYTHTKRFLKCRKNSSELFQRNLCIPTKLESNLRQAGFHALESRYCTFRFLPPPVLSRLSLRLDKRLDRLASPLLRKWIGAQYLVRAEKAP